MKIILLLSLIMSTSTTFAQSKRAISQMLKFIAAYKMATYTSDQIEQEQAEKEARKKQIEAIKTDLKGSIINRLTKVVKNSHFKS